MCTSVSDMLKQPAGGHCGQQQHGGAAARGAELPNVRTCRSVRNTGAIARQDCRTTEAAALAGDFHADSAAKHPRPVAHQRGTISSAAPWQLVSAAHLLNATAPALRHSVRSVLPCRRPSSKWLTCWRSLRKPAKLWQMSRSRGKLDYCAHFVPSIKVACMSVHQG